MGEWMDKLRGRIKSGIGRTTGDRSLEAEGEKDRAKGNIKGAAEEVKQDIKDVVRGDPNTNRM